MAQQGKTGPKVKPMKGIVKGTSVLQVTDRYDGETYRTVYTVSFPGAVYVLHAFQKKSRSGIRTTRRDVDVIRVRMEKARTDHGLRQP